MILAVCWAGVWGSLSRFFFFEFRTFLEVNFPGGSEVPDLGKRKLDEFEGGSVFG